MLPVEITFFAVPLSCSRGVGYVIPPHVFGPLRFVRDSSLRVAWDPVFVNVVCFNCSQLEKDQIFFSAKGSEKVSLCEKFLHALTIRMDPTVVGFK